MKAISLIKPNTFFFNTFGRMFMKTSTVNKKGLSKCISMFSNHYGEGYIVYFKPDEIFRPLKKSKKKVEVKQVVRIENLGRGFFRPTNRQLTNTNIYNDICVKHGEFPTPMDDGIRMSLSNKTWFCGYKSIEQINAWLSQEDVKWLIKKDFKVVLYEVTEYQEGGYQIAFTQQGVLSQTDITSLFI